MEEAGQNIPIEQVVPKSKRKLISIVVAILVFFIVVALLVIKWNYPDFPLLWVGVGLLIVVILGGGIFLFFHYYRHDEEKKEEEKRKLPEPLDIEELRKIAMNALTNETHMDHIRSIHHDAVVSAGNVHKSLVYVMGGKSLFPSKDNRVSVVMSAHEPRKRIAIIRGEHVNSRNINIEVNRMSIDPKDKPDIEETTIDNPLTGTRTHRKSIKHSKTPKKEEKKGDLE